jgi:hypothetical protein
LVTPAPPPYPADAPNQQPNNTLGLLALIFGIVSIPVGICCSLFTLPFGIAGVVLGYLGKQKAAQGLATNGGQANAGLITGAIGTVLGIALFIISLVFDFASLVDVPGTN